MDYNNNDLPLGFGMALMMNERARAGFEGLSETEKEHIILKCKDAKSRAEMDKIVDSLMPDENVNDLFNGPGIG